jgi:AsmA family/AsmA-like C-terminal region
VQTTLLGLAIAIIVAIVAALVAPLVVDWNHYRSTFETEASRLTGLSVRVNGAIDARILPSPRLKLHDVEVGEAGHAPLIRAGSLDLEVRLGPLVRGDIEATEAHLVSPQIALSLDRSGAIDWPAVTRRFGPDELSVSRLSIEDGSITLADAASGARLTLQKLSFAGDVRSLLGPFQGEGTFAVGDKPFSYRISGGRADADSGLKIRLGVDPSDQPLTTSLDGALTFDHGTPQFDGALTVARPFGVALSNGERVMSDPWQATATIHATPAAASLKDVAFQYGPDERAINVTGKADLTFGDHPHVDGEVSALDVNVDRALAAPDVTNRPPLLMIKNFVEAAVPAAKLPMPGKIGVSIAGLTVGGTTVQSLHGAVRFDDSGWSLDNVELRAPGLTAVSVSGRLTATAHGLTFSGPGTLESADADTLLAWLSGRGDRASGGVRILHARGDVTVAGERFAVDGLTAALDQESVAGHFAYTWPEADHPAIVEADLHATKLDLDALAAFAKTAVDEDGFALPHQGSLKLDVGKVTFAGVDALGVKAQAKFDAGALQIERLSIGDLGDAAFDVSGRIDELSSQPRGRISVDLDAGALAGLTRLLGRFAPRTADVLRRAGDHLAPAKVHATVTVDRAPTAGSSAKLDLSGQVGLLRVALNGEANGEPARLGESSMRIDGRLDADDGTALTALFGLDHVIGVDQLPGRVTLSATGPRNGELRIDADAAASGATAAVRGTLRLSGEQAPVGVFQVLATAADLRPLQQAMTGQLGNAVPVSARAAVAVNGAALSLTQIAVADGKAAMHGRLAVNLGSPIGIDGDLGADNVDGTWLTTMLLGLPAQAQGAAGLWSSQPVGAGAFGPMNGAVSFTFDHAAFTPTLIASSLKGVAQFRPSEIALNDLDGNLAGGHVAGALAFHRDGNGVVGHGQLALADADAATMLAADNKTIDARLTLKADFDSIGATPAALVRMLHGGGTIALNDAHIGGLDPAAFAAAVQAAGQSTVIDPAKIQPAVNAALVNGRLTVPQGNVVLTITDGKINVANVILPATDGGALALSGTLDLNTAAVDARLVLSAPPPAHALIAIRPELAVALKGPLAAPVRTLDIAALNGWLTQRASELLNRQLESIEANGRQEVLGRAVRPDFPIVRAAPTGAMVDAELPASAPSARGSDLLQPDLPAAGVTGSTPTPRPRPAVQPSAPAAVAPHAAGPAASAPLNLLRP